MASSFTDLMASLMVIFILLFVASGCAALIYEVVWFQLLQIVIGSSALSLGILLGTFMGGMCLGSLLLPRFISAGKHPLRVYAYLEFAIGILGILIVSWLVRVWAFSSRRSPASPHRR